MKRFFVLWFTLGLAAIAIVIWFELRWVRPARPPQTHFATRAEAEAAGVFASGWMPAFVPAGATELYELHDPTTSRTWGRFVLADPSWNPPVVTSVRGPPPSDIALRGPTIKLKWWPAEAASLIDASQLRSMGYRVSLTDEPQGLLVVAIRGTDVLFWRLARGVGA
ncbi:MAG: hypothetical protein JST92_20645 [Deltaproteobacteria bacterium]|nr:hypothetical protein [Deltaproteobacteria bacterium]